MSKPKEYTARLCDFFFDTLNDSGDEYVRLLLLIEQKVKHRAVQKTYYLTSQAAKEHLLDEIGKMGQHVDSMHDARKALDECINLRVRLKVKIDKKFRTNYYILGRCDETTTASK